MGMDLERKVFSTAPEYFIAGAEIGIAKAVKTAGAALPAHAPVLLGSGGKLALLTAPAEGKTVDTAGLYGILPEPAAEDEEVVVYLTGELFADSLVLPEGVTAADIEVALRNIGIFLK